MTAAVEAANAKGETVATRKASQLALTQLAPKLPELIGGSADLMGSVFTNWPGSQVVTRTTAGNIVNFGVREFAMAAISNGLALHGGFSPETGTFLTFSDYSRNALRMAALMKLRIFRVYPRSIGSAKTAATQGDRAHGEPAADSNMAVWRPATPCEAVAWGVALQRRDARRPSSCLARTSRFNNAPPCRSRRLRAAAMARGCGRRKPRAVLIATGSEVPLAWRRATSEESGVNVASCRSLHFTIDAQTQPTRGGVTAGDSARAIEAGVTDGWRKYTGAVDSRAVRWSHRPLRRIGAAGAVSAFRFTVEN